ncbi:MAG: hypothetical protein ABI267_10235 [Ginsengibacter sp.]
MEEKMRPLTKKMIKHLQLARAKELSEKEAKVITPGHFKGTLSGLYKRGIVKTRKIVLEGKPIESVYITFEGVRYLDWHDAKQARKAALVKSA